MLTLKIIESDKRESLFPLSNEVVYSPELRTIYYHDIHGNELEEQLYDGDVAYVVNDKGVTISRFG
ncbi:hypothetical protein RGO69_003267 [Morganella morganii]|nr:hypothetical protein [Morganella morganii]